MYRIVTSKSDDFIGKLFELVQKKLIQTNIEYRKCLYMGCVGYKLIQTYIVHIVSSINLSGNLIGKMV